MKLVPAIISSKLGHNTLLLKKSSPTVLFGVGIVGVVGGTILACRATLKMSTLLDESTDRMEKARTYQHFDYTEKDRSHDIALIRTQTSLGIIKLYVPPLFVTGVGVAALVGSHKILTSRNTALTAAYATLDEAYKRYRSRVIDELGPDKDLEFRHGVEKVEVGTGDKKKKVKRASSGEPSGYAVFFDQTAMSWQRDPEYNYAFLLAQQNWFSDMLRLRGHVFLNEVYDALGVTRTSAGAVVGWVYTDDGTSDNYVSFGIFEDNRSDQVREFLSGHKNSVLLDFNVDGIVYDLIDKNKEEVIVWQPNS